ncbi:MAG: DUF1178 family protein [Burkholderiaceae bacterium]|nr:DUF1178 family protein [Burkholderiaceae bacterium]
MKVLDLCCGTGHVFEGWFASEEEYHSQRESGMLDCPVCGNADVERRPSAPRLNLSRARTPEAEEGSRSAAAPVAVNGPAATRLVEAVAELLKNTQDVGDRFAEEARRIHYGESDAKAIRGKTTPEEREALADEGIEVFTLPVGLPDKGALQ